MEPIFVTASPLQSDGGFNGMAVCVIMIMSAALGVVGWNADDNFVALLSDPGRRRRLRFPAAELPEGQAVPWRRRGLFPGLLGIRDRRLAAGA